MLRRSPGGVQCGFSHLAQMSPSEESAKAEQDSAKAEQDSTAQVVASVSEVHLETVAATTTVAPTGKRQAFRDIRRQLQEQELSNPGVQKLLLEELETADA